MHIELLRHIAQQQENLYTVTPLFFECMYIFIIIIIIYVLKYQQKERMTHK